MCEIWKECLDGWYEVSNLGNVRRAKPGRSTWIGRRLKNKPNSDGYPTVTYSIHSKTKHATVHGLVAGAFLGPCPPGLEVNHKDGVKNNNDSTNLEYMSRKGNIHHAFRTGLSKTKFSQSTIEVVRAFGRSGLRLAKISLLTGVSEPHCSQIINRNTRKVNWITGKPAEDPPCPQPTIDRIIELRRQGELFREIALITGIRRNHCRQICNQIVLLNPGE